MSPKILGRGGHWTKYSCCFPGIITSSCAAKTWAGIMFRSQTKGLKTWDNIQERLAPNGICFAGVVQGEDLLTLLSCLSSRKRERGREGHKGGQQVDGDPQAEKKGWGWRKIKHREYFWRCSSTPRALTGQGRPGTRVRNRLLKSFLHPNN